MRAGADRPVAPEALAEAIGPGERVFVPGSAGEPTALIAAWAARPELSRGLRITTSAVPGINPLPLDALDPSATVAGPFMQPQFRDAQRSGRFRHLPLSYWGFARELAERAAFDTCVVQVAPPDADGRCSLGAAVEFTPLAAARSRRVLALINPLMPRLPGAVSLPFDGFALAAEVATPLPSYDVGAPAAEATAIAERVASFVEDGAALQAGLGKVPEALFGLLADRRGLRLHSGMLGAGALRLAEGRALDPGFAPTSCVWVGTAALYSELDGRRDVRVRGCEETHDIGRIAALGRFVAVNSALSVDLFGQANLEHAGGRAVSGVGGAADFAAAARQSAGGLSVVALPASFGREPRSRVVPRLAPDVASLPRHAVDVVVTEHGAADLRGLSVHGRAEALVAVAAPAFRGELADAWRAMSRAL